MRLKKAFSLLELIFVIVVIGVVASVAVPKFMDTKADAQASTIKQDVLTMISSIRSYALVNSEINSFDNILTLNENNWNVESTKAIFKEDDSSCVDIEVSDSTLTVTLNSENSGIICSKIKNLGLSDMSYDLY